MVGDEEVEEGRDEQARGLLLGRDAEELCVEQDDVVFAGELSARRKIEHVSNN